MEDHNKSNHAEMDEAVGQDSQTVSVQGADQETIDPKEAIKAEEVSPETTPMTHGIIKPKKSFKKLLFVVAIAVLLVGAVGTTYYFTKKSVQKSSTLNSTNSTSTDQKTPTATEATALPKEFAWLDTPQKVDPLPLFKDIRSFIHSINEENTETDATYYKLGEGPTNTIYAVDVPGYVGPGSEGVQLVVDKTGTTYTVLLLHGPGFFYKTAANATAVYSGPELANGVKLDDKRVLTDIKTPVAITYNGQKFITKTTTGDYAYTDRGVFTPEVTESATTKKIADVPEGTIYEFINKDEPDYRVSHYALLMKHHFLVTLNIDGELSRSEVEPITWSDGSRNTVDFTSGAQGCGGSMNNEIAKVTATQLKPIGKTDGGQKIYGFSEITNSLLKKHYDEYALFKSETYVEEAHRNLTIEQYSAKPEIFLVEDGLGRFLLFESTKTRMGGGCAKPVVYLYPTTPTLVNVSVGANITLSEPLYGEGWSNVMASPNGLLGYNGKQYDSLFWEGYGKGNYPDITEGAVVPRADAASTMKNQLSQQGLNTKEINDFMAFWEPKIPTAPYVRLTWLGTQAMEKLAPLYISPMPDTRLRVFLDMEGLSNNVPMKAQVLHSTVRSGFTVVEWGGLARDGSVPALQ